MTSAESANAIAVGGEMTSTAAGSDSTDNTTRRSPGWRVLAGVQRYGRRFSATGLALALVVFCFSLTPSLIPREWLYQGVVSGICVVLGYSFGALVEWVIVKIGFRIRWNPRASRVAWWILLGCTVILVPLFVVSGVRWQNDIRALFGMNPTTSVHGAAIVLTTLVVALVMLQLSRGLRRVVQWLTGLVNRLIPKPVARLVSILVVTTVVFLLFTGVIWNGALRLLNNVYGTANQSIDPTLTAPAAAERSGSPNSPETWESLGAAGRQFVASGPTLPELQAFAAAGTALDPATVRVPIRVYGGLNPDGDLEATAADVVAELDRTNAWDRSILVVATTTGTGWIDPGMSDSLEFMHGGDTAIATMQYSYLPSWISFVGDRSTPPAAGKALFEAVYAKWSTLPEATRPKLIAQGISLGSFGMQGAFSGIQDLTERSNGALFLGTPSFTELWADLTDNRDPGSLERQPVVDNGKDVRWGEQIADGINLTYLGGDWDAPRVVYVQHASDGVVWWSPSLLWAKPDRLNESRGPDVLDSVDWYPVVTFFQATSDLFVAGAADIPQGHGHQYRPEYADALAVLWAPDGWSGDDTARLKIAVSDLITASGGN